VRAVSGRVDLVDWNDLVDEFDTGADRHTNLGSGHIDGADLADVVRDAGAPVVVETPGGVEGQSADIAWLRARLAG
jgi:deoxyribonuclease IV